MIDLDREIRALLEEDARHAPLAPDARRAIRRTRRRQVGVVLTTLAVVAAAAVGSVAGVSALMRPSERQIPMGPNETPPPAPPPPAVVTGSALDGYVATTFPWVGHLGDLAVAPDGAVWGAGWQRVGDTIDGSIARFDGETWTTYTSDDGLPPMPMTGQARVNTVEVAPDGTVWAGTDLGLARLDGETWTIVSPPVTVLDVAFAPDGSVAASVRSAPGMSGEKIDYELARFRDGTWAPAARDFPSFPTALDVDPVDGSVWVGTGGGFGAVGSVSRFDGTTWTTWLEPEWLFGGNAVEVVVGPDESVWVLTGGVLDRFDGRTWAVFPLPARAFPEGMGNGSMAVGPDGSIWIAGFDRGSENAMLFRFDGAAWTRDSLGGSDAPEVGVAADGTVWVSVDDSLMRFTPVQP